MTDTMRAEFLAELENELKSVLSQSGESSSLCEAMSYAVFSGGKRLRPICAKLGAEFALGREMQKSELNTVLKVAAAVELIHTYSLIHDDLPCMDNDDFRRGKPTVHKKFGEATAVLAGDALLNLAYELLFELSAKKPKISESAKIIAKNAGFRGMVKGQFMDLNSENVSAEKLLEINSYKTGCMFKAAFLSGAVAVSSAEREISALEIYAENLGAAFQIADDLLDEGKKENSVVRKIGAEKAKILAAEFTEKAKNSISDFGSKNAELKNFADGLLTRKF